MKRLGLFFVVALISAFAWAQSPVVNIDFAPRGMQGGFYSGPAGLRSSTNRVTNMLAGSTTFDFPAQTTTCANTTLAVAGAQANDPCFTSLPAPPPANFYVSCFVSAANTVTLRGCAVGTATDPASATYNVRVVSNQ